MSYATEQLRALVEEATPGPWRWLHEIGIDDSDVNTIIVDHPDPEKHAQGIAKAVAGSPIYQNADARLIALAPQLAELVADMAEALARTIFNTKGYTGPDVWWKPDADALLARLDALFSEEDVT